MSDEKEREELELILTGMLAKAVWGPHRKPLSDVLMDWHQRHPPAQEAKVWPCGHISRSYDQNWDWLILGGGSQSGLCVPRSWSLCPVAGCGARRPEEPKQECKHEWHTCEGAAMPDTHWCSKCGSTSRHEKPVKIELGDKLRMVSEMGEIALYKKGPADLDWVRVHERQFECIPDEFYKTHHFEWAKVEGEKFESQDPEGKNIVYGEDRPAPQEKPHPTDYEARGFEKPPTYKPQEPPAEKPDWYSRDKGGTVYTAGRDPEITCWHCERTFLCDPMDATCRLCGAPFDKKRCAEFGFVPSHKPAVATEEEVRVIVIARCLTQNFKAASGETTETRMLKVARWILERDRAKDKQIAALQKAGDAMSHAFITGSGMPLAAAEWDELRGA